MKSPSRDLGVALLATGVARAVVLYLGIFVWWDSPFVSHMVQDLRTWHDFFVLARNGFVPYVSFWKEYPVGAGLVYWILAPLVDPENLRQTVLVHGIAMGAVDLGNTAIIYSLLRGKAERRALPFTLLFSLNLTALSLGPIRFESVVTLFVLLGYRAAEKQHPLRAVALWAAGFWVKWVPAFLIAAQEWRLFRVERRHRQWLASFGVFAAVALAINGPFALAALARGSMEPFLAPWIYHVRRPLYWDTLLGVLEMWLGPLPWERYGSVWTLGLVLLVLLVRPGLRLAYKGALLCIAAIVFNRIYSAQFHLWFYPLLLLGAIRERGSRFAKILALAGALDVLNFFVYPLSFAFAYGEMGGFYPYSARERGGSWTMAMSAAIVLRTAVLVGVGAMLLKGPEEGPGSDVAPPSPNRARASSRRAR